jgi:hypothetical protein
LHALTKAEKPAEENRFGNQQLGKSAFESGASSCVAATESRHGVSRGFVEQTVQAPSGAAENDLRNNGSFAPSGAYGFFARFPRLSPWAIIFRHSVAGFRVHFQKLICAPGSFFT